MTSIGFMSLVLLILVPTLLSSACDHHRNENETSVYAYTVGIWNKRLTYGQLSKSRSYPRLLGCMCKLWKRGLEMRLLIFMPAPFSFDALDIDLNRTCRIYSYLWIIELGIGNERIMGRHSMSYRKSGYCNH